MKPMTFGSLFSGVGGFDLGLEQAGLTCQWQVEIDPFCQRILQLRFPHVKRRHDDANTFALTKDEGLNVDVICGGDPCQGNSNAGSVWGREHPDMGSEFLRIIATIRPRIVIRENPARTRPDALWPWHRMRDGLGQLGYQVLPFRLRACCLGLDHERDRLFLLATLPDANGQRLEGIDWQRQPSRDACRTGCCTGRREWRNGLPSSRICRGIDGIPHRMDRLRGLGNAVPPPVAHFIGRRLIEADQAAETN